MTCAPITYRIQPVSPSAHHFEVHCTVARPDSAGQIFALPAWIPGSYLIRDFARHIIAIKATSGGKAVALTKIDKHSWQAPPLKPAAALSVTYTVYAWDLSVRGAHLDATHAFFNGTSVFLRVLGQEDAPCLIDIAPPELADSPDCRDCHDWRLATALPPAVDEAGAAKPHGFGLYRAENYDALIDHPVEMGRFALARFEACGVPHEVVITGRHDCDMDRLTTDLKRICEWQIRFFGEPAPMAKYTFLVTAVGDGYGGLEHRASTALFCSRNDLPYPGMRDLSEGYRTFLGLCSHEYFHSWNIKRIKPAGFVPYDLGRENYTSLLWVFEGFTSYYDDLALLRSGVIGQQDWLELMAKTIARVESAPGRLRQSLAESSFDAWSKFYRPDENTPNAVVSYYAKGALFALALDLTLRRGTQGRVSLDDVMRALWQRFGSLGAPGLGDDDVQTIAEELSGLQLKRFFADGIRGTGDLPLASLLAAFGIKLVWDAPTMPSLGVRTACDGSDLKLSTVFDGSAAQNGGLAAGDVLVALNGLRVTADKLDKLLARHQAGDPIELHAFRRDELMRFEIRLDPPRPEKLTLKAARRANALRLAWLGA